jgi:NADH:ubiquinone oxidoreductase subunit E
MITLSQELGVPLIEVWRVAHFYKAFSLEPRGKHVITVCLGTACHVRGASRALDQVTAQLNLKPGGTTEDGLFTVEVVNCLGTCALGPVVVLDGVYYEHMTPRKLNRLIASVREAEREGAAHA